MKIKTQIAIALLASVLAEKTAYEGVKAFINTSRPSSIDDLCDLLNRVRKGEYALAKAYKDDRGYWHFFTTA